jgi:hypothetical protein
MELRKRSILGQKNTRFPDVDVNSLLFRHCKTLESIVEEEHRSPLLLKYIVKSIVLISDLFSFAQFEWMLELFQKLFEADQIDDFLVKQYLVLGIFKVRLH